MKKIVILGAGPTGLGAAYRLYELEYKNWDLYEKNNHIGGLCASYKDTSGFTWDIGGHVIFSNLDRFNQLVDDLLGNDVLEFKRESWIWLKNNFIAYPFQNNFHLHPNKNLVYDCVIGLLNNHLNTNAYHNFEEWIYHFFGYGIAQHFMIPYNKKVWKCPLSSMAHDWIAERISIIDIKRILKNVVFGRNDSDWGPNNTFRYPSSGGVGGLFTNLVPFVDERLHKKKEAIRIRPEKKQVVFQDGDTVTYDTLISTVPLNELIGKIKRTTQEIESSVKKFMWTSGYMVGLGIDKPCPSRKNWMYFPQSDSPFYRVTYLSNYSPNMTPSAETFSLLAEVSFSNSKSVSRQTIIEDTVNGLINSKLLTEKERDLIISDYVIEVPYSLPVPFVGRDKALKHIQSFLATHHIFSRGRFGGWKYEIGNMDHSFIQGMEIVDRILFDKNEALYRFQ